MLTLGKYQGLGNDFLVALDGRGFDAAASERATGEASAGNPTDGSALAGHNTSGGSALAGHDAGGSSAPAGDPTGELARALCDRHTGLGADGVLILREATAAGAIRMELRNADGGRAETSGNGLRCLALAVIDAGLVNGPEVVIETDAGTRRATCLHREPHGSAQVSVEMGRLEIRASEPIAEASLPGSMGRPWTAWSVDAGNPHLVVLAPALDGVEIAVAGAALERKRAGGQNVEIVTRGLTDGDLSLLVFERGVGVTLACGSGSVAAAGALHAAGLCSASVRVHNPGGTAEVALSGDDPFRPFAELAGAVRRVARIEADPIGLGAPEVVVVAS